MMHSDYDYMHRKYNNGELQGDDLELASSSPQAAVIHRGVDLFSLSRSLYLSLSLLAALYLHSPRVEKQENEKQQ